MAETNHILASGDSDSTSKVPSVFRFIFALIIFLVYTLTAVIMAKTVKYKFSFKVFLNIFAFVISMGINLLYGIFSLIYHENLIQYIHIPQTIEEFVLTYTFYSLLYEMRIVYLKIICDDHKKYRKRKR